MIMELNTTNNINSLLEPDDDDEEEYFDCEDNEEYFNHENDEDIIFPLFDQNLLYIPMIMGLNTTDNINSLLEPDDEDDEEEYLDCEDNKEYFNQENDEEFTFIYLDENNTPIPADKALKNKDIHPIFPLFDQNLLSHEERKQLLPINPQVNKVFVESYEVALSSTSVYDRIESVAMGQYCTRKKQPPKLSKKSNSTCFDKLCRLKDKIGCSNSDCQDAFVFLKKPVRSAVEGSSLKGNGGKRKGLKAENGKFSGHELCLSSMGPFYKDGIHIRFIQTRQEKDLKQFLSEQHSGKLHDSTRALRKDELDGLIINAGSKFFQEYCNDD
ncbi:hypothetical protein Tco_0196392 [Tanacetum coccineum]